MTRSARWSSPTSYLAPENGSSFITPPVGWRRFTDDVMSDLLEDDLGTASFDGKNWSKSHHHGGQRGRSSHQVANDK